MIDTTNSSTSVNVTPGIYYGWLCPACGRGCSPWVNYCPCKGEVQAQPYPGIPYYPMPYYPVWQPNYYPSVYTTGTSGTQPYNPNWTAQNTNKV